MYKNFLYAASMAALLCACSESSDVESTSEETSQTAINMSVYTASTTRAGDAGAISSAQQLAERGGFGVFAYQTETADYTAGQTDYLPDFMYNQQITGTDVEAPVWSYTPIKYWPNDLVSEDGTTTSRKVSFFAYAPYTTLGDSETSGITDFSDNDSKGDPTVTYTLATGSNVENVDLLWGTAGSGNGTTEGGNAQNGAKLSNASGEVVGKAAVNANLTKMKTNGKVQFNFKHALAQFGGYDENNKVGILIKADPDIVTDASGDTLLGNETIITVKSLTITTDGAGTVDNNNKQSLYTSGTLNLATGVWTLGDAAATTLETSLTSASSTEEREFK
jgi:hypothetical protein